MGAWSRYALVAAAVLVLLAIGTIAVVPGAQPPSIWLAAGVAWAVQLAAFGVLVRGRGGPTGFLVGWGGGMALRFAAVAGMAGWVTVSDAHDPASALVGLIGFVMALVLIEPVFLRMAD